MEDTTPKPIELLYEAALQGNLSLLEESLRRDEFLLNRLVSPPPSNTRPLHVACKLGHSNFVLQILSRKPSLAEELDPNDKYSSLLHLAVRNGDLVLVTYLLSVNPDLCFARDMDGRNPVHLAAIKGRLHVLEELLRAAPAAARERVGLLRLGTSGGDTVLHLCVKFNQLEALMLTVRMVGDTQMLNAPDAEGNTILHVAVANKHLEIIDFLLEDKRLKKNSLNSNGVTAMDIFEETFTSLDNNNVDFQLRSGIQREKVKGAKKELKKDEFLKWFEKQRNTLMIVASLIATMAFQAGLNPPGGVWQDSNSHVAGTSIMAQENSHTYTRFFKWNSVGFILSMSSILLLISELGFYKQFFMGLIIVTMWVAVAVMAFTYGLTSVDLIPDTHLNRTEHRVFINYTAVWISVMVLLLVGHFIKWPMRFIKYRRNRM